MSKNTSGSSGGYALLLLILFGCAVGAYLLYFHPPGVNGQMPIQKDLQVLDAAKAARDTMQAHEKASQKALEGN